jgi:hypothetical protein
VGAAKCTETDKIIITIILIGTFLRPLCMRTLSPCTLMQPEFIFLTARPLVAVAVLGLIYIYNY